MLFNSKSIVSMKKPSLFLLLCFPIILCAQINPKTGRKLNKFFQTKETVKLASYFTPVRTPGGLAYDPVDKHLYAYGTNSLLIHRYETNGELGPGEKIPYETVYKSAISAYKLPAKAASLGLDFATESFMLGETNVPANSLLIFNGKETSREITVVDKYTGQVIAGMDIANGSYVGGVYVPGRKTFFLIESKSDKIMEVDPISGKVISSFGINAGGDQQLDIFGGAIEYNDQTNTLFVVTDGPTVIREFSPGGEFIKDYRLDDLLEKPDLIQAIKGLSFDEEGSLWVVSTSGRRVGVLTNLKKG